MNLSKKIISIAAVLALCVTIGVYSFVKSVKVSSGNSYLEVYVAKKDIPEKTKIDETMVALEKIDSKYVLKNAVLDRGNIIGKITTEKIVQDEQIVSDRIEDLNKSSFSYNIPEDKRAVTISVDGVNGVAFLLNKGDFVDVMVYEGKQEINKVSYPETAKMILKKVQVLAVDENSSTSDDSQKSQQTQKKVTLALSSADAEKLLLADSFGKIRLALRNPDTDNTDATPGAVRDDILPQKGMETK
ncbi:MAG: Flp pilus assembly protein CpaB [Clostridiaceae bacterium]